MMLAVATRDPRVQVDPAPSVHVETFLNDRIILQLRAWVPTPSYLEALRDVTEQTKLAVNRLLAGGPDHADVSVAADPQTMKPGEATPTL